VDALKPLAAIPLKQISEIWLHFGERFALLRFIDNGVPSKTWNPCDGQ
jgi:hypothetical protein